MPQPHIYTATHRSPKLLNSQQKYFKAPVDSIFSVCPIEIENVNRINKQNIPECCTIEPDQPSRKDREASNTDFLRNSTSGRTVRPSLNLNLQSDIPSSLCKDMASQRFIENLKDEYKISAEKTEVNREGLLFPSTNKLNLTWLSPINKVELEDSEDDDSRSYPSFEESLLDDLSPIYALKTVPKISDESKAFLDMFNVSSCQKPKQSQDTDFSQKDESRHLLKIDHSGNELSKDISTDLSIEIHQIDNVTKRQESEGTILSENDMILVDLTFSSID